MLCVTLTPIGSWTLMGLEEHQSATTLLVGNPSLFQRLSPFQRFPWHASHDVHSGVLMIGRRGYLHQENTLRIAHFPADEGQNVAARLNLEESFKFQQKDRSITSGRLLLLMEVVKNKCNIFILLCWIIYKNTILLYKTHCVKIMSVEWVGR